MKNSPDLIGQIRNAALAFPVLMAVGFAVGLARPELMRDVLSRFTGAMAEAGMYQMDGSAMMLTILVNNLVTALAAIASGFVPFLRLPALTLGVNALLMGGFASYYVNNNIGLLPFLAGTLPHGVTELTALCFCCGAGLYLCDCVTRRLLGQRDGPSVVQALRMCLTLYTRYAAPLLALSAMLEAFVTPMIFGMFYQQ